MKTYRDTLRLVLLLLVVFAATGQAAVTLAQPAGDKPSTGWALQSFIRASEAERGGQPPVTLMSRIIASYNHGAPSCLKPDGTLSMYAEDIGIVPLWWNQEKAEPAAEPAPFPDSPPAVLVQRDGRLDVQHCTLAPVRIADGLWLSITMSVVSKTARDPSVIGRDFLMAQMHVCGGEFGRHSTIKEINREFLIDLWSQTKKARITVGDWERGETAGHVSTLVYGPLLYRVLASEPEYLLIGERKITLSHQFKEGCKELCRKVASLRAADGQPEIPEFRGLKGERAQKETDRVPHVNW